MVSGPVAKAEGPIGPRSPCSFSSQLLLSLSQAPGHKTAEQINKSPPAPSSLVTPPRPQVPPLLPPTLSLQFSLKPDSLSLHSTGRQQRQATGDRDRDRTPAVRSPSCATLPSSAPFGPCSRQMAHKELCLRPGLFPTKHLCFLQVRLRNPEGGLRHPSALEPASGCYLAKSPFARHRRAGRKGLT